MSLDVSDSVTITVTEENLAFLANTTLDDFYKGLPEAEVLKAFKAAEQ